MIKITERNSELPATNLETPGTYLLVLHPRNKGMNNAVCHEKKANPYDNRHHCREEYYHTAYTSLLIGERTSESHSCKLFHIRYGGK